MSFGSWDILNDDIQEEPFQANLLPSSLQDVVGAQPHPFVQFQNDHHHFNTPIPESAPIRPYFENRITETPLSDLNFDESSSNQVFFNVEFRPFRISLFRAKRGAHFNINDYVVTEADRGYDIGKIISEVQKPPQHEIRNAKFITRLASPHEVSQLPEKLQKEEKACILCQKKADEFGLPMTITGAEYQFDGKKLTFYFTATKYVDFRNLVRSLFKVFGIRIWMVWHDGHAPIRDVMNHAEQTQ